MTQRFETTMELPECGVTRDLFYELLRTMTPTDGLVDGETIQVVGGELVAMSILPRWKKISLAYTDFQAASTTKQADLFTLPAAAVVHAVKIKPSVTFAGTSITDVKISVGTTGTPTKYAAAYDVDAAVGDAVFQVSSTVGGETHASAGAALVAQAVSTGANLSALSAGAVDVWVLYSVTL